MFLFRGMLWAFLSLLAVATAIPHLTGTETADISTAKVARGKTASSAAVDLAAPEGAHTRLYYREIYPREPLGKKPRQGYIYTIDGIKWNPHWFGDVRAKDKAKALKFDLFNWLVEIENKNALSKEIGKVTGEDDQGSVRITIIFPSVGTPELAERIEGWLTAVLKARTKDSPVEKVKT